jgi:hypothetical protein
MAYSKPVVLAQNSKQGSFAAGCPESGVRNISMGGQCCKNCERAR